MTNRPVTERDFRRPEFRDADPADYEIRDDGAVVRKDRWERGIRRIAARLLAVDGQFEVDDVVTAAVAAWNTALELSIRQEIGVSWKEQSNG